LCAVVNVGQESCCLAWPADVRQDELRSRAPEAPLAGIGGHRGPGQNRSSSCRRTEQYHGHQAVEQPAPTINNSLPSVIIDFDFNNIIIFASFIIAQQSAGELSSPALSGSISINVNSKQQLPGNNNWSDQQVFDSGTSRTLSVHPSHVLPSPTWTHNISGQAAFLGVCTQQVALTLIAPGHNDRSSSSSNLTLGSSCLVPMSL
jgi:hypothetical protein